MQESALEGLPVEIVESFRGCIWLCVLDEHEALAYAFGVDRQMDLEDCVSIK